MRICEYRLRRRVQFYEVDGAGIVHFSWFFRYMEEAEHGLWRSAGLPMEVLKGMSLPRVATAFEYHRPLRFGDECDVLIRIASIGRTSIGYACEVTLAGELAARGTMTVVCVSIAPGEAMKPTPFPAEILDRLEPASRSA